MTSIFNSMLIRRSIGPYSFIAHMGDNNPFNEGFFFNNDEFLSSRRLNGKLFHFELRSRYGKVAARMSIYYSDNMAYSPWKAPFGSVECYKNLEINILEGYIKAILESLPSLGIRELKIIHYPEFYDAEGSRKVDHVFTLSNIKREVEECNQHIRIGKSGFEQQISYSQRKRLNKCIRSGFQVGLEDIESLDEAYELLVESRERKNYPVTMSFDELAKMFEKHPSRYLLFAVREKKKMIAMAISIRISKNILYDFYHADHNGFSSFSPTVMAVGAVYEYSQKEGFDYIDLGISSLYGNLNEGIYKFKKGLGAIDGVKLKYSWSYQQS